jgi:hypothetical protein
MNNHDSSNKKCPVNFQDKVKFPLCNCPEAAPEKKYAGLTKSELDEALDVPIFLQRNPEPEAAPDIAESCYSHKGDPCVYCGVPHDDVPPGPCKARELVDVDAIQAWLERHKYTVWKHPVSEQMHSYITSLLSALAASEQMVRSANLVATQSLNRVKQLESDLVLLTPVCLPGNPGDDCDPILRWTDGDVRSLKAQLTESRLLTAWVRKNYPMVANEAIDGTLAALQQENSDD